MAEIDSISSVNEDLNLQYQQTLSQLQDLDYAKAISDLTRKQTDLQAAQQSFVKMSQLSLFNYL
jgi:flagellar hook-associated protein 3 FlgL